jgi:hypothetical protein
MKSSLFPGTLYSGESVIGRCSSAVFSSVGVFSIGVPAFDFQLGHSIRVFLSATAGLGLFLHFSYRFFILPATFVDSFFLNTSRHLRKAKAF